LGATVDVKVSVPILGSTTLVVYLIDESGCWRGCGLGAA